MNPISSIHDPQIDEIFETHYQPEINIELYSTGFLDGIAELDA